MRARLWGGLALAALVGCGDGGGGGGGGAPADAAGAGDAGTGTPDGATRDSAVPDGAVPDGAVPDGAVPDGARTDAVERDDAGERDDAAVVDPCADVRCDTPPAPTCDERGDRVTHQVPGTCRNDGGAGVCEYLEVVEPCPEGQRCVEGECVEPPPAPAPGELVITEVMYDPRGPLADDRAEWVELHNLADGPRRLDGCTLADPEHEQGLGDLAILGGGFVVLARSEDPEENGGLRPDGVFEFGLGNDRETLRLICDGEVFDEVTWDEAAGFPEARGAALALDPGALDPAANDAPESWCVAEFPYFGEGDDAHRGTPGAANPPCPPPDVAVDACRLVEPVDVEAGAGTSLELVGRVREAGLTDRSDGVDEDPDLRAEAGWGRRGAAPGDRWTWVAAAGTPGWDAAASGDEGEDEYRVTVRVPAAGLYDVAFRFSLDGGETWTFCDRDGGDYEVERAGHLTSVPSPCADELCATPPASACADDLVRVAWEGPGTCAVEDGRAVCAYREVRTDCSDLGGACVGGDCIGAWPVAGAGDVVFTEVMYDPDEPLADETAEWFEVLNVADGPRTLHGCRLEDDNDFELLRRVLLQPGERLLFARSVDPALNGGLEPDHVFGFGLGGGGDTLTIRCGDMVVDSVTWGPGFPDADRTAIALDPGAGDAAANDDGARWCLARDVYYEAPPDGDHRGTPGAPNPPCDAPTCEPNPCVHPPLDECADEGTVRRFPETGTCAIDAGGIQCRYDPVDEACPAGRVCVRGACVLPDRQPPRPGEVLFTEVMADPHHDLADATAEWFELHNATDHRVTLDGCEVRDGSGDAQPLAGLLLEPRGYVLLARSDDPAVNGGLRPDHGFEFRLGNDGDRLTLSCGGQVIDAVDYHGFRIGPGRALSLDPGSLDAAANDGAGAWCLARVPYLRDPDGDNLGSPRAPNPPCAVPVDACSLVDSDVLSGAPFQWLRGMGQVRVDGVTDRSPRVDPADDLRGQLGFGPPDTPPGAGWTWIEAAGDPAWDANAAGAPGFDRYRADFVTPIEGPLDLVFRFSADGGFSWTVCEGTGELRVLDDGPCVGEGCAGPQPGEIVVTEIMYDPHFALDDDDAEWIELYNASIRPVNLLGCVLADDPERPEALTIDDLTLEPGDYALFARSADPAVNGGLEPHATFAFGLNNGGDRVVLVCDGVEVDRVEYDAGETFPVASARSLSLDPGALDANERGESWCLGSTPYFEDAVGDDRDNLGTPGAPNPPCGGAGGPAPAACEARWVDCLCDYECLAADEVVPDCDARCRPHGRPLACRVLDDGACWRIHCDEDADCPDGATCQPIQRGDLGGRACRFGGPPGPPPPPGPG